MGPPLKGNQLSLYSLAFSPDGQTLAAASDNVPLRLWDVKSIQPSGTFQARHASAVSSIDCSPDGKVLASAGGKTIILWDLKTRKYHLGTRK